MNKNNKNWGDMNKCFKVSIGYNIFMKISSNGK